MCGPVIRVDFPWNTKLIIVIRMVVGFVDVPFETIF
jgi:hypothetical protein